MSMESYLLAKLKYAFFRRKGRKIKITALEALCLDGPSAWAPRGIDNFTSVQQHNPYTIGKLLIRPVKICNFSRIGHKTEEFRAFQSVKMTVRRAYIVTVLCTFAIVTDMGTGVNGCEQV